MKDDDPKSNPSKFHQYGGKRFTILYAGCGTIAFLEGCSFFLDSKIEHRDYHKTMNQHVFLDWVVNQLLPAKKKLSGKTVVVMDNAPYHSIIIDKPVNSNTKKAVMDNWLRQHHVEIDGESTKKQLYALIKPLACNYIKSYVINELTDN